MPTLHITNGDSVAETLARLVPADEPILPWRDILHDGPVPAQSAAELRETRAQFLSDRGLATHALVLADLQGRDAQLAALGSHDRVVLWFEPDLYDQLQLLQILNQFYLRPLMERPAISIVASDELLGPLEQPELARYLDRPRAVREVDLELAALAWQAFTSNDPQALSDFVSGAGTGTGTASFRYGSGTVPATIRYRDDETVVLPHLHAALHRLLEERPSAINGLSRTEQQIGDALLAAPRTLFDLYASAHQLKEEMVWLGDLSFVWYVDRLMSGPVPLLQFVSDAGSPDIAAGFSNRMGDLAPEIWKRTVQLTPAGQSVVESRASTLTLNGIDRWMGGVHLIQLPG
jgi:hypothetical protein